MRLPGSFEEATHRTTRWLDRCISAHGRPHEQNLFGIVQGGLDPELRRISIQASTCLFVFTVAALGLRGCDCCMCGGLLCGCATCAQKHQRPAGRNQHMCLHWMCLAPCAARHAMHQPLLS